MQERSKGKVYVFSGQGVSFDWGCFSCAFKLSLPKSSELKDIGVHFFES